MNMQTFAATMVPNWMFLLLIAVAVGAGQIWAWKFRDVPTSRALLVAMTLCVATIGLVLVEGPVPIHFTFWTLVFFIGLSCVAAIDLLTKTVPDVVVFPLIALGLAHAASQDGLLLPFSIGVFAVIVLGLLGNLINRQKSGWIGGGDVLLVAAAMAWLGPGLLPDLVAITALGLLLQLLIGFARRDRGNDECLYMPLAPALGFSQVVIWLGGPLF